LVLDPWNPHHVQQYTFPTFLCQDGGRVERDTQYPISIPKVKYTTLKPLDQRLLALKLALSIFLCRSGSQRRTPEWLSAPASLGNPRNAMCLVAHVSRLDMLEWQIFVLRCLFWSLGLFSFLRKWTKGMLNLQQKYPRKTRPILLTCVAAGITKSTGTTQSACLLLGVPLEALVTNSTRSSLWQAATGDD
jgi:hypothetical protein